MEPRSVVVQPHGDNFTMWSATQIPHILRVMAGDGHRHPRAQAARHRPRRRRRVRRQAAGHPGGDHLPDGGPPAGQAGQVDRDPQRVADDGAPRPRPDPVHRHRRRPRGQRQGSQGAAAGRHGRLPADDHPGRAGPRRLHVPGDLQVPGLPLRVRRGLHQQGAHRRLPRRRPARGHLRHRADHGRARRRAGHGPARAAPQELDQGARSSRSRRSPASSTTAATTRWPPSRRWS